MLLYVEFELSTGLMHYHTRTNGGDGGYISIIVCVVGARRV